MKIIIYIQACVRCVCIYVNILIYFRYKVFNVKSISNQHYYIIAYLIIKKLFVANSRASIKFNSLNAQTSVIQSNGVLISCGVIIRNMRAAIQRCVLINENHGFQSFLAGAHLKVFLQLHSFFNIYIYITRQVFSLYINIRLIRRLVPLLFERNFYVRLHNMQTRYNEKKKKNWSFFFLINNVS